MAINWFPGHMASARREIRKAMPKVDLVLEVLDARIPDSSENPLVAALRGDTPCIKVLNKRDLADPAVTAAWVTHLERTPGVSAVPLQREQRAEAMGLIERGKRMLPADRTPGKPVTVMIVGVPNVGKSTLINTLAGRTLAKTSNKPAVTRAQQRIPVAGNVVLLDTPGFLWPKLTPPVCGYRLAVTGAIADNVVDFEELGVFLAEFLCRAYPDALRQRYGLDEVPEDPNALLDLVAARRGCIRKGGEIDRQKVSEVLIMDLRRGSLGPISLEQPPTLVPVLRTP